MGLGSFMFHKAGWEDLLVHAASVGSSETSLSNGTKFALDERTHNVQYSTENYYTRKEAGKYDLYQDQNESTKADPDKTQVTELVHEAIKPVVTIRVRMFGEAEGHLSTKLQESSKTHWPPRGSEKPI